MNNPSFQRDAMRMLATLGLLMATTLSLAATPMGAAVVQAPQGTAVPSTGDAWLDATLADIDRYAARYPDAFADELHRYYGAPRDLVAQLLGPQHWRAGDVYFACALARVAAQPCRAVSALRTRAPAQAWSTIALQLGIGVDSPQFHRLKRGVVLSYEHWARPLQVDAALHAEFPAHPLSGKSASPAHEANAQEKPGRGKERVR